MTREEGLKQIDTAKWIPFPEYKEYRMVVHDKKGNPWTGYLSIRNSYCDRGHLLLHVDGYDRARFGPGADNEIDVSDVFPRFFFSIEEATTHFKIFLKWRLWKHRSFSYHPSIERDIRTREYPDLVDYSSIKLKQE